MKQVSEERMRLRIEYSRETDLIFSDNIPSYADWLEKRLASKNIEVLPTDDEIKEIMTTSHYHHESGNYRKVRLDRIQGAKMIRDLIKKRIQENS
jgi:hypothetical protein